MDKRDLLFAIFSLVLFVLFSVFVWKEMTPVWATYQQNYNKMMTEYLGKPFKEPIKVKQVWVEKMNNTTDRCITCHVGMSDPGISNNFTGIYASHPNPTLANGKKFLDAHKTDRIGCTVCHEGQGRATRQEPAHGYGHYSKHWGKTLLVGEAVQASCNKCHTNEPKEWVDKNTPAIAEAIKVTERVGCVSCHTIAPSGYTYNLSWDGKLAPELTQEGSKDHTKFIWEYVVMQSVPALKDKVQKLAKENKQKDRTQYTDYEVALLESFNEGKFPEDPSKLTLDTKHIDRTPWNWLKLHFIEPGSVSKIKDAATGEETDTMMVAITGQLSAHEADLLSAFVLSMRDPSDLHIPAEFLPKKETAK